jgi:hypothetical protein
MLRLMGMTTRRLQSCHGFGRVEKSFEEQPKRLRQCHKEANRVLEGTLSESIRFRVLSVGFSSTQEGSSSSRHGSECTPSSRCLDHRAARAMTLKHLGSVKEQVSREWGTKESAIFSCSTREKTRTRNTPTKQIAQKRSTTSDPLCDHEAQWIHDIRLTSLVVRNRVVEGVQTRIGGSVWKLWSQSSYPATYSDGGIEVPV